MRIDQEVTTDVPGDTLSKFLPSRKLQYYRKLSPLYQSSWLLLTMLSSRSLQKSPLFLLAPFLQNPSSAASNSQKPILSLWSSLPKKSPLLQKSPHPLWKSTLLKSTTSLLKNISNGSPDHLSLKLPASTTPLITEDAPQDNGLQIPMPPVNLPLALQKHHMILHCPLKRRHMVEQGSSTWQNEQLHERPQMGVYKYAPLR